MLQCHEKDYLRKQDNSYVQVEVVRTKFLTVVCVRVYMTICMMAL